MFALTLRGTLAAALLLLAAPLARAQEFQVRTLISTFKKPGAAAVDVTWTTSLFHAGKVYDSIGGGNQMTICEPAQERFVILDGARELATEYRFEVIRDEIERLQRHAETKIREIRQNSARRDLQKGADLLEFMVHPKFAVRDQRTSETRGVLTFSGAFADYSIKYEVAGPDHPLEAYLDYLNWAARLNYIRDPQVEKLPPPRLEMYAELRRRKLLPTEVTLDWKTPDAKQPVALRRVANHTFGWEINTENRKSIPYWEKKLQSPGLEWNFFDPSKSASTTASKPAQGTASKSASAAASKPASALSQR